MINTLFLPQKKFSKKRNFYRFFSLFTFHGCYGVRDRAVPCLCCNASGTTGTKACLLIHGNPSKEDNTGRQHRNTTPEHNTERKTTPKHKTERQHRKATQKHNHVLATHQDFKHPVGRDDQGTWWQVTVLLG